MGTTTRVGTGWAGIYETVQLEHRPHLPVCPHSGYSLLTWGGIWGPCGESSQGFLGLKGLGLHLQRLRLPQGPAQGLGLLLEGTIALPGEPELELNAGIGLLQEDLGRRSHTREPKSELMAQPPPSGLSPLILYPSLPPLILYLTLAPLTLSNPLSPL